MCLQQQGMMNMGMPMKPTPIQFCQHCETKLERKRLPSGNLESLLHFNRRKFCDRGCMAKAFENKPKTSDPSWMTAHYHARKDDAGRGMREVWINGPNGCSPQGRELAKQLAGKSGEALPVLPLERTSTEIEMPHLRKANEGARLLREALSAVQKVWRPVDGESKPEFTTSAVRRLTPRECERLMGFQWLVDADYPGAWQDDAGPLVVAGLHRHTLARQATQPRRPTLQSTRQFMGGA
jgi:site-specific DNA-cytosine methylase